MKRPETHTPVLFFRIQYAQGGVQTTYVRVANHLAEEGRPPHVFSLLRRGPLLAHFHPQVPVQTGLLGVFRPRFFRTLRAVDAVFIPDCYCLCIVAIFSPVLRLLNVKVLLAVYHPREYHFHGVLRRCYRTLVDSLAELDTDPESESLVEIDSDDEPEPLSLVVSEGVDDWLSEVLTDSLSEMMRLGASSPLWNS